ncbi:leucine-rich repeat-containing protein 40-like [Anneissia japonica]|uniref:leucine-rich repeat-containing protein 40-like n=1 Tax=Anneissia japonica TaxID=1529436 RepID=UPI0014257F0C|nr:leucine-rich repeat-containing protein 40-like [Anneissia japonica]
MSKRGRQPFNKRAGFQRQQEPASGVSAALLKQGRRSGQLNLSSRELTTVPDSVWRINQDVPEEARNVSLDNTEDRWWEQTDLTKLILASNKLLEISNDLRELGALTVLDVHDNLLTSLPDALGELQQLQRFNASHNKLTSVPDSLWHATSLTVLNLQHNLLTELPAGIGELRNLEDLNLSNNKISVISTSIGGLSRLRVLNLAENSLTSIPYSFGMLKNVVSLDLNNNQLGEIPSEIGRMSSLQQLYLRHNRLTHLPLLPDCSSLKELHVGNNRIAEITPKHLEHLTSVSVLDLRDNKVKVVPDEITLLQGLNRFDLSNNDISSLPFKLGTLPHLKSLVIDGNPMRSIRSDIIRRGTVGLMKYLRDRIQEEPVANGSGDSGASEATPSGIIGSTQVVSGKTLDFTQKKASSIPLHLWEPAQASEVTIVNFSKNVLTEVPENIILLSKSVQEVNLGFNKLSKMPVEMQMMVRLTTLDLRCNALSTLPSEFNSLKEMRELTISSNRFKELPAVIYTWGKLETILASENQVTAIDVASIRSLPKLSTLDLSNNDIGEVPPELGLIESLRSLQLSGNRFRNPRPAVLNKGTVSLLAYLRDRIPT